MRKLRGLLIFPGTDVGPFHGRAEEKKMKVAPVGCGERARSEVSGILNQFNF